MPVSPTDAPPTPSAVATPAERNEKLAAKLRELGVDPDAVE